MRERPCIECRRVLPESEFGRTGSSNVLRNQCRECYNRIYRERYRERQIAKGLPARIPDMAKASKTCRDCKHDFLVSEFREIRRKGRVYCYSSRCRSCDRKNDFRKVREWRARNPGGHARFQQKYRETHPEKARASFQHWKETHPEYEVNRGARRRADPKQRQILRKNNIRYKARIAAAPGDGLTAEQVRDLKRRPCHYCGKPAVEIDHVVPIGNGGAHSIENVVPACRSCNARKWMRTPEQWRKVTHAVDDCRKREN